MNVFQSVKKEVLVPIHPAGWPFIFLFWLVTFVISYFWFPFLLPGSFLSVWCIYFFRNPRRITPVGENLVVSPADGRVLSTGVADIPDDLPLPDGEWRRISIFMNVFDVHVNRAPVTGEVMATPYHEQYGIIRFGSRVDVWLPSTTTVQVMQGQTMLAGETVLADLSATMPEITQSKCR